jgi:hypothetical protein
MAGGAVSTDHTRLDSPVEMIFESLRSRAKRSLFARMRRILPWSTLRCRRRLSLAHNTPLQCYTRCDSHLIVPVSLSPCATDTSIRFYRPPSIPYALPCLPSHQATSQLPQPAQPAPRSLDDIFSSSGLEHSGHSAVPFCT